MTAPGRQPRRATSRIALLLAALSIMGSGAFALWPVRTEAPPVTAIQRPATSGVKQLAALNPAAFRVPIWVAEPAPPALLAPVVSTPPPPLKLQLLAVFKEGDGYKAAIYDPDADKLLVVAAGQKIGAEGRTVEGIAKSSVTIRDGIGLRTLALTDAKGGNP